ncbi:hypothetical protein CDAR_49321 [Caerostris darwini]|uniref:Uncharacterized protein n=1 Tax=Caerostris darwini TaxID=1538125 RepID=A0AAV4Q757_9ARAC|nr:hypothetical protein CDAR_49321 [Caerostris darwini]
MEGGVVSSAIRIVIMIMGGMGSESLMPPFLHARYSLNVYLGKPGCRANDKLDFACRGAEGPFATKLLNEI